MNSELIDNLKKFVLKDNKCQNGKTYKSVIKKNFPEIYENIKGDFFKEHLYMLLFDIAKHPVCPVCGKLLPLRNWIKGFQKTCSKECLGKFQASSKEFAKKISDAHLKKNIKLNNLKARYPDLNIEYNQNTKQYIIKNYCQHGDIVFQTDLNILNKLKSEGKCLCIKCNEEFIKNYIPTKSDITNFQNNIINFRNKYSGAFSKEWFIRYYPKEYKIILYYTKDEYNISLMERIVLFQNKLHKIPECSVENCHNKCKWGESKSAYYSHCDKHINYNWQSKGEKELKQFLTNLNIKFEYNNRTILNDGKELDIFIPEYNIAIEYNGLFWHNEKNTGKKSYLKWKECKDKNIQLLTIWEDDWRQRQEIVKDIIKTKLKLNKKIYARNCILKEIDYNIEKSFLNNNHLQGYCQSSIRLGLFYNNKLYACMTFGKSRFKENEYELLRFACLNGYTIIGGFSKLLTYFIKNYNFNESIISYANCDISNGNVYIKNNFKEISHSLNYWWCKNGEKYSRYKFMKHKLIQQGFDKNKSENEIMKELKYYKVYGTGNLKFQYNFS